MKKVINLRAMITTPIEDGKAATFVTEDKKIYTTSPVESHHENGIIAILNTANTQYIIQKTLIGGVL